MDHKKEKDTPLIGPWSGGPSTEGFDQASPVELADALEQLLDSMSEETYDPELVAAYLDALEKKAPILEPPPDPRVAQAAFLRRLDPLQSKETEPEARSVKRRGWRRGLVTVAATMAALLALMIGAQAAGMDIFGNLARWTDETIHFILPDREQEASPYYEPFRKALEDNGLPGELAPRWYPEGFVTEGPEVENNKYGGGVHLRFFNAVGKEFAVTISRHSDVDRFGTKEYEKDTTSVEVYTKNGRTFYILANFRDTTWAAWSNEELDAIIYGSLSVDDIKDIIDSIGV